MVRTARMANGSFEKFFALAGRWWYCLGVFLVLTALSAPVLGKNILRGQKAVNIPLSCIGSVSVSDILALDPNINGVANVYEGFIRGAVGNAALCEAIDARDGRVCAPLTHFGRDYDRRCRFNYMRGLFVKNLQSPSPDFFNLCSNEILLLGIVRKPFIGLFCHELVKTSVSGSVKNFCDKVSRYMNGRGDRSHHAVECEAAFANFDGYSACRSKNGDILGLSCLDLVKARQAVKSGNPSICGGEGMCLAVLGAPRACQVLSHRAVAMFCSSSNISRYVKEVAIENAFRRVTGAAPYIQGQTFTARDSLAGENQLRTNMGLPSFRIGDPLLSTMPESQRANYLESHQRRSRQPAGN
ncbi:MAG: hypothetical protein ACYCPQ_10185 [Elusimicrobiota bacterium]